MHVCTHMHSHTCVSLPQHLSRGQRTTCSGQFSSSIVRVLKATPWFISWAPLCFETGSQIPVRPWISDPCDLPPKCWDGRSAPPLLVYIVLGLRPRASCMPREHFTNLASSLPLCVLLSSTDDSGSLSVLYLTTICPRPWVVFICLREETKGLPLFPQTDFFLHLVSAFWAWKKRLESLSSSEKMHVSHPSVSAQDIHNIKRKINKHRKPQITTSNRPQQKLGVCLGNMWANIRHACFTVSEHRFRTKETVIMHSLQTKMPNTALSTGKQ